MTSSTPFSAFHWVTPPRSASSGPSSSRGDVSTAGHGRFSSMPNPWSTGNWRVNASPPPSPPPPPRPECRRGRVVKLPEQHEVPANSIFHQEVVGKAMGNPWNHPVVVTKTWESNGEKLVKIRSCTSWGGQGIGRKQAKHHHFYVEADESQLAFASGKFDKPTWVNCSPDHELTIEFEHLQLWTGKAIQFRQSALDSFNKNERVRRDSVLDN